MVRLKMMVRVGGYLIALTQDDHKPMSILDHHVLAGRTTPSQKHALGIGYLGQKLWKGALGWGRGGEKAD